MLRHTKYRPYIRRLRPDDTSDSFRIAMRIEYYKLIGKPAYVIVQHGFRHHVIDVGRTRRELMRTPLPCAVGAKTFKRWAKDLQARASGRRS